MAITFTWEADDLLRIRYQGQWKSDEFYESGRQAIFMVRSRQHPVYLINDFSESEMPPLGVLWQARNIEPMRPANWAGGVIITRDSLLIHLADVFMSVYMRVQQRRRLYIVNSNAEALEKIAQLREEGHSV